MSRGGKRAGSGRKKINRDIRLVTDNPGKRAFDDDSPQPGNPEPSTKNITMRCPEWFDADTRKLWQNLKKLLTEERIIEKTDAHSLNQLAFALQTWEKAGKKIQDGLKFVDSKNVVVDNPYATTEEKFSARCQKLLDAFHLTPSARARMKADLFKPPKKDEFEDFLSKKGG